MKQTFDAEEMSRHPHGSDGFVAALKIGDSDLLIMGGRSMRGQERFGAFHVFVPDCDVTYKRAIEAGGTSLGEPADRPYGERSGFVKDFAGNYWYIATPLGAPAHTEGLGTVTPYLHPSKARPLIDFVKKAFNAQELAVYEQGGRVMHAAVRIGDTVMEMGESPDFQPSSFYLHVEDCDAVYQQRDRSRRDVSLAAHRSGLGRPHRGTSRSLRLSVDAGHAASRTCVEPTPLATNDTARDGRAGAADRCGMLEIFRIPHPQLLHHAA